jgi:hypothetical protein
MKTIIEKRFKPNGLILLSVLFISLNYSDCEVRAQEMPPRPVSVSLSQDLSFGALSPGTGGYVWVSPYGIRTASPGITLFTTGWPYHPAIFVIQGNAGTVVHCLLGPDAVLTGSNGGSLSVQLGPYTPGDPIILTSSIPGQTQVYLGGRLSVSDIMANPPGTYSGIFTVMFVQE